MKIKKVETTRHKCENPDCLNRDMNDGTLVIKITLSRNKYIHLCCVCTHELYNKHRDCKMSEEYKIKCHCCY